MSSIYQEDSDYEHQNRYTDSPEFDNLKEEVITELFEINGQISTLQQFTSSLNGLYKKGNVNVKVVENIDKKSMDNIKKVSTLIVNVNELVHGMNNFDESDLDRTQVIAREKILRDVQYSVQEFQNTQKAYASIIKKINAKAKLALDAAEQHKVAIEQEEEAEDRGQVQQPRDRILEYSIHREPINNEEFAYQANLIRQRDEEITNIEQGITELNDIFKDLGSVVQQQGLIVDNIEANIYSAADNTAMASRELNKAVRSQKNANKWCIYLLIGLSFMLGMLLLIVLI